MHLQQAVEGYDVFARSLSIGAGDDGDEVPPRAAHARPVRRRAQLPRRRTGSEVVTISRLVNAFFRWEFNSCESLVRGCGGVPHRLRQRLPGRGADLAALLLPLGDGGAAALDRVLRGHRPAVPPRPGHLAVLRDRRPRRSVVRGQAGGVPAPRRRVLRDRAVRRLLLLAAGPRRRDGLRLGAFAGVRRAARGHGARHVPAPRARPVCRAFPGAARSMDQRPWAHSCRSEPWPTAKSAAPRVRQISCASWQESKATERRSNRGC